MWIVERLRSAIPVGIVAQPVLDLNGDAAAAKFPTLADLWNGGHRQIQKINCANVVDVAAVSVHFHQATKRMSSSRRFLVWANLEWNRPAVVHPAFAHVGRPVRSVGCQLARVRAAMKLEAVALAMSIVPALAL